MPKRSLNQSSAACATSVLQDGAFGMGKSPKIWEDPGDPWGLGTLGTSGDLWGPLGTSGDLWGPLGTSGDLWGPLGTSGDLWGPLVVL